MIPKIVHYCWFGRGEKSELINKCMDSWKRYLPEYEIIEWNEDNFDINCCDFVRQAYAAKKWAFVADYARLYALYKNGGVYLDTDMELFKSVDDFLDGNFFAGFEANDITGTAILGASKGNTLIRKFSEWYECREFVDYKSDGDILPNPFVLTDLLKNIGMSINGKRQRKNGISLYPQIIFYPNGITRIFNKIPKSAYAVHHAEQSWMNDPKSTKSFFARIRRFAVGVLRNAIGTSRTYRLKQNILKLLKKS